MWQLDLDFSQPLPEPTIAQTTVASNPVVDYSKVKFNRDGSRKLEDFGEDLQNTRKARKRTSPEELEDRIMSQPLDKVWPKNSILELKNDRAAALLWIMRQTLPPRRPVQSHKVAVYRRKVMAMMQMQEAIENSDLNSYDVIESSPFLIDDAYMWSSSATYLAFIDRKYWPLIGPRRIRNANDMAKWNHWELPNGGDHTDEKIRVLLPCFSMNYEDSFHGYKLIEARSMEEMGALANAYLEASLSKQQTQQKNNKTSKPITFSYQRIDSSKVKLFGKRGSFTIPLKEIEASTLEDIRDYIKGHEADLTQYFDSVQQELSRDEYSYRVNLIRERVGTDWRHGKDVSPEQFMETFGFRGVEFGNWVSQGKNSRERQWMLNNSFDALNDLAELLGLPAKAMALDGTLGLAFGSRGSGKASAHYEPQTKVINLTKTKGYSSLAHEWFHALDHYIARTNSEDLAKFQSQYGQCAYKARDDIGEKLSAQGLPDEYLQGAKEAIVWSEHFFNLRFRHSNEAQWVVRAVNRNSPGDILDFPVKLSKEDFEPYYPELLRTSIRPELFHAWRETIETIRSTRMSERTLNRAINKGKGSSFESDYWYSKIEQAARCFEGFVSSKLESQGKISDFLSQGTFARQEIKSESQLFYPYLDGDDLDRVSEKFEKVFEVLRTRQTEKGVMLFSRLIDNSPGTNNAEIRNVLKKHFGNDTLLALENNKLLRIVKNENEAHVEAMLLRAEREGHARVTNRIVSDSSLLKDSQDLSFTQGFYDQESHCSFLIADNLKKENIIPVLLHEIGVHMANDDEFKHQLNPIIERAFQIVQDGIKAEDPVALSVNNRLKQSNIKPTDANFKEELCGYLVEEVAVKDIQEPKMVQWFNQVTSTINIWLYEHGLKTVDSLSSQDLAKIAQNNVRELSRFKIVENLGHMSEIDLNSDLAPSCVKEPIEEPRLTENVKKLSNLRQSLTEDFGETLGMRMLEPIKKEILVADKKGLVYEKSNFLKSDPIEVNKKKDLGRTI